MAHDKPATPVAHSRPEQGRGSTLAAGVAPVYYPDPWGESVTRYAAKSLAEARNYLGWSLWMEIKGDAFKAGAFAFGANGFYADYLFYLGEVGYVLE